MENILFTPKFFVIYGVIFMALAIVWVVIRRLIDRKNGKMYFNLKEELADDGAFLVTAFMSSLCFAIAVLLKFMSILQN